MTQVECATDLLIRLIEEADGLVRTDPGFGGGVTLVFNGKQEDFYPGDESIIGLEYGVSQNWFQQTYTQIKVTPHGRAIYESLPQESSDDTASGALIEGDEIVHFLIRSLSKEYPAIQPGHTKAELIEKSLSSLSRVEDKCKLALEILANDEIANLTKSILQENQTLASETKILAAETARMSQATVCLAVLTLVTVITSACALFWTWQDRAVNNQQRERAERLDDRERELKQREDFVLKKGETVNQSTRGRPLWRRS